MGNETPNATSWWWWCGGGRAQMGRNLIGERNRALQERGEVK